MSSDAASVAAARPWVVGLVGVACILGCRPRGAEGAGTASSAAPVSSATASATAVPSSAPALPPPGDGCWGEPPAPATPKRELLSSLAERCQLGNATLLAEPVVGRVAVGAPVTVSLPAPSTAACLRALVVAEPTVFELRVELLDGGRRVRADGVQKGRFALLGRHGPVCVRAGETTTLRVEAARGSGEVLVQVHRAP